MFGYDSIREWLVGILYMLPVCLLSLSVHEFSHGFVADKLGDPTARMAGRLTLNPMKHIDPLGFIAFIVLRFGWAKPVPVNISNFKNKKRDIALTAIAGPISNFLLALIFAFIFQGFYKLIYLNYSTIATNSVISKLIPILSNLLYYFVISNICLAIFNLIPVYPLDGSRVLYSFLPYTAENKMKRIEKYLQLALILVLITGYLGNPLYIAATTVSNWFFALAGLVIPI